jgi:hypothetical protein
LIRRKLRAKPNDQACPKARPVGLRPHDRKPSVSTLNGMPVSLDSDPIQPRRARIATESVHRFVQSRTFIGIQNP